MFVALGLLFIWIVGIRDYLLSTRLLAAQGPEAELNFLARLLHVHVGGESLLYFKAAGLLVCTIAVLMTRRCDRSIADRLVAVGMLFSGALALWWDLALL